jgi:hypothetical protein
MKAARFGRLEVVKFLVQAGANRDKQNKVCVNMLKILYLDLCIRLC